jgi:SAM-dependent methyltransferase
MAKRINKREHRPIEQLREQFEIEKELAGRLKAASAAERTHLYASLYDELFRRVPHHPQLTRKISPEEQIQEVQAQMKFLLVFLTKGTVFLEIGPGDCALAFEVAKNVKKVYAVDVSKEVTTSKTTPENFELFLSDGSSIPLPPKSMDVVYSYHLMEHLHPDDARKQLQNIYDVLVPGGLYVCVTPNRLNGPHDISMHFERVARGFHLKEYINSELSALFRSVGFSKVKAYGRGRGFYLPCPLSLVIGCEYVLSLLPYELAKSLALTKILQSVLGIRLVGVK